MSELKQVVIVSTTDVQAGASLKSARYLPSIIVVYNVASFCVAIVSVLYMSY